MSKIDEKIDGLTEEVAKLRNSVEVGFATYNEQLKQHIQGVKDNHVEITAIREELVPVQDHVKFIQALAKLVLGIATIAGVIFAGIEIFVK